MICFYVYDVLLASECIILKKGKKDLFNQHVVNINMWLVQHNICNAGIETHLLQNLLLHSIAFKLRYGLCHIVKRALEGMFTYGYISFVTWPKTIIITKKLIFPFSTMMSSLNTTSTFPLVLTLFL